MRSWSNIFDQFRTLEHNLQIVQICKKMDQIFLDQDKAGDLSSPWFCSLYNKSTNRPTNNHLTLLLNSQKVSQRKLCGLAFSYIKNFLCWISIIKTIIFFYSNVTSIFFLIWMLMIETVLLLAATISFQFHLLKIIFLCCLPRLKEIFLNPTLEQKLKVKFIFFCAVASLCIVWGRIPKRAITAMWKKCIHASCAFFVICIFSCFTLLLWRYKGHFMKGIKEMKKKFCRAINRIRITIAVCSYKFSVFSSISCNGKNILLAIFCQNDWIIVYFIAYFHKMFICWWWKFYSLICNLNYRVILHQ